jgi:hypothetical protein
MKKKEYNAPDFKVIVLRARHCLYEASPYDVDAKKAKTADEGEYFD